MTPFDFINAITYTKEDLFEDPQAKKDYSAYIVNRGLSMYPDTIMNANAMNMYPGIPEQWQFSYLLNSISKRKRFSKWQKKDKESENLALIKEYFGYSSEKASKVLDVLTVEQIEIIRDRMNKGGK